MATYNNKPSKEDRIASRGLKKYAKKEEKLWKKDVKKQERKKKRMHPKEGTERGLYLYGGFSDAEPGEEQPIWSREVKVTGERGIGGKRKKEITITKRGKVTGKKVKYKNASKKPGKLMSALKKASQKMKDSRMKRYPG
jgi:hypothetical protein